MAPSFVEGPPMARWFPNKMNMEKGLSKLSPDIKVYHWVCSICGKALAIPIESNVIQGDVNIVIGVTNIMQTAISIHMTDHMVSFDNEIVTKLVSLEHIVEDIRDIINSDEGFSAQYI